VLLFTSVSKRVFLQTFSYENEFDLHNNKLSGETHFHNNGFAGRFGNGFFTFFLFLVFFVVGSFFFSSDR